mmetsp:Transcript_13873/g.13400  ORF Transcript_13873/g.13400 Transcript_13873/m.13400 type:complete len:221 (-) Transcript_13873:94-756(-)
MYTCMHIYVHILGAGLSEGSLHATTSIVISHIQGIIKWAVINLECTDVILWSRGMSTAGAIEYTSQAHNDIYSKTIKFLVLDSPYASVKQVVDTVLSEFQAKVTYNLGVAIGRPLCYACSWMFGKEVTARLGGDVYAIQPIKFAPKNKTPCLILSARKDDYIPHIHADQFHDKWLGPCGLHKIDCSSFDQRPAHVVLLAYDHVKTYVELPYIDQEEDLHL